MTDRKRLVICAFQAVERRVGGLPFVASRVVSALSAFAVCMFAAGTDPLGAAMLPVAAVTVLVVIAAPVPFVCPAWGTRLVSLSQVVALRLGRVSPELGGEDCPLILTVKPAAGPRHDDVYRAAPGRTRTGDA